MIKPLESKLFSIKDYNDGQKLMSNIIGYREMCMEKYNGRCQCKTKLVKDGILVIIEEANKNKEKNESTEGEER